MFPAFRFVISADRQAQHGVHALCHGPAEDQHGYTGPERTAIGIGWMLLSSLDNAHSTLR